jgi:hypothetical protein
MGLLIGGIVRVFKTRGFSRFMRKEGITDDDLRVTVARAERGLIDADLGSGVIKQRVPRRGQGRSGGFRTLIAFKAAERSVFLYGFAKNDQDNIDADELKTLRKASSEMLGWSEEQVAAMSASGGWTEVRDGREEVQE